MRGLPRPGFAIGKRLVHILRVNSRLAAQRVILEMNYRRLVVAIVIAVLVGILAIISPLPAALKMVVVIVGCGAAAASYYANTYSDMDDASPDGPSTRRNDIKDVLSCFLERGIILRMRIYDLDDAEIEGETEAWTQHAAAYIADNLGAEYLDRFHSVAGITVFIHHIGNESRLPMVMELVVQTIRLEQFIKEFSFQELRRRTIRELWRGWRHRAVERSAEVRRPDLDAAGE
jgi:hypothetical protein